MVNCACNIPPKVQYGLRVLELLAAFISLILYGIYTAETLNGSRSPVQYVLSIIAAAFLWTTTAAIKYCWNRRQGGDKEGTTTRKKLTVAVIAFVIVDVAFVVLFIAVAALTGPGGAGRGNGCRRPDGDDDGDDDDEDDGDDGDDESSEGGAGSCGLVRATFALSIVNMLVFAIRTMWKIFDR